MLADLIAAIAAKLPAGTASLVGGKHIGVMGVPPRVVWVPTEDKFAAARQHGPSPRSIKTRVAGVVVHIWAKGASPDQDLAAAEQLVNDVLWATHQEAYGSYEVVGGTWLGQDGEELTQLGRAYLLELQFQVPITAPAPTTQTIETTDVQGGMTFPSGDVADGTEAP
jgi:hypothetical protein